jgi:hypothetical protein
MKCSPVLQRRPGFSLADLLLSILIVVIALGLLLPAAQRVNYGGWARVRSQNNLKQIGLAIHEWAATNNGRFWVGNGLRNAVPMPPDIPKPGKGGFWVEILPFMEGNSVYDNIGTEGFNYPPFKAYVAPLDPTNDYSAPMLSYGLNGYLANLGTDNAGNRGAACTGPMGTGPATPPPYQGGVKVPGRWWVVIPNAFGLRGTSNVVGTAERLAQASLVNPADRRTFYSVPPCPANVAGYNLVTDPYFYPPHISAIPVTSAGFDPGDATAFLFRAGVDVQMMDASVRLVALSNGGRWTGDNSAFDIACSLSNPTQLPSSW